MAVPPKILGRYVAYKDSVLAHYNRLLEEHDLKSVRILIESLREMDKMHKEHIETNKSMICPPCADFATNLSLMPVHEYKHVSKVLDDIITFKKKAIDAHFTGINEETVKTIMETEEDIHNQLKSEKAKHHV